MDTDKAEGPQRSIEALLARIEAQKLVLASLLREPGPRLLLAPLNPNSAASINTTSAGARKVR